MRKFDKSVFYNFGPLLSRNGVYNFVVGGRGIGKTFGAKCQVIRDYLKDGSQFILLRRYKTELTTRSTFFDDIIAESSFTGYGFRIRGLEAQLTRNPNDEKPDWETIGYFVALSNSQSKKSVAYPRVKTIIFDEFIIEKGAIHYLRDEATVMTNFYSTVDRYQDRVRVLFLANAVSINNPYFLEYDILPGGKEWYKSHGGFIVCHFPDDSKFTNAVAQTRFGKFIGGTEYADYAVASNFRDNSDALIGDKDPNANYFISLELESGETFAIWRLFHPVDHTQWWVTRQQPKIPARATMIPSRLDEDSILVHRNDTLPSTLRTAFTHGRMTFDNAGTRNAFTHIFKR